MPRHHAKYGEEQKRWAEMRQNPRPIQPNPEQPTPTNFALPERSLRGVATVNNPNNKRTRDFTHKMATSAIQGLCTIQVLDQTWKTYVAAIDHGRRCSSTLDIRANFADAIGYQVKRFNRKVYRKLNNLSIKGIGTVTLPVQTVTGDIEHREAMVWEGTNFPYDIRFHHSLAHQFLRKKEVEISPEDGAIAPPPETSLDLPQHVPAPPLSLPADPSALLLTPEDIRTTGGDGASGLENSYEVPGHIAADSPSTSIISTSMEVPLRDFSMTPNPSGDFNLFEPMSGEFIHNLVDATAYQFALNQAADTNLNQSLNPSVNPSQDVIIGPLYGHVGNTGYGQSSITHNYEAGDIHQGQNFDQVGPSNPMMSHSHVDNISHLNPYDQVGTNPTPNLQHMGMGQDAFYPPPQDTTNIPRPTIRANTQRKFVNSAVSDASGDLRDDEHCLQDVGSFDTLHPNWP